MIIVISGPGGVGKGTVVTDLVRKDDLLFLSRSWTTRHPRPGEDPGAYTFVTPAEFEEALTAGAFLEWNQFLGSEWYGSPMPDPTETRDLVLEIDVNGARQIVERGLDPLLIFIDAPSIDVQRRRLEGRGDSPDQVDRRLAAGAAERELAADLPFRYVINDSIDRARDEIAGLIRELRSAVGRTTF